MATAQTWETVTPQAAGFASDPGGAMDRLERDGRLQGLHGVVALRGGRVVLERYWRGADNAWGRALGEVAHGPDTLHDIRSVTKSVVGLLYAIALEQGLVPPPDAPLLAQFPEYPDLAAEPQRQRLTVRHALTMTLGLAWDETKPYTDPTNSEIAMEMAPDRLRYVLEQPVLGEPGRGWIYGGGAVALIGRLIERGSGQRLPDFASKVLFAPLGITSFEWIAGSDGVASAASGLRLSPRSLARIGQLLLQDGRWNGQALVSAAAIAACMHPAAMADIGWPGLRYGHFWYLGEFLLRGATGSYGAPFFAGLGNGGQRLFVVPTLDLVLVTLSGLYDDPDMWRAPAAVLFHAVLPALTGRGVGIDEG